ncbi:hypothetical protein [Polaribacter sp. R77954]|uniref:hypothetical protein n=1 Tax=Polaribacter sp. R77954 TaxID=3093870 RepID=UPI0037C871C8
MTTKDKQIEFKEKVLKGLEKVYEKMVEFKKEKNTEIVIMKGDNIIKIKPE